MARPKKELKKIKRKRAKRAKEKAKLYLKGEIPFQSLPKLAKKALKKMKKQEVRPS